MSLEILYPTLANDEQNTSLIDIVAIHGLAEGANETWTHGGTGINWLRDLLPYAAKGALRPRILSYSYDADIAIILGNDASKTILRHAHTLVSTLQAERSLTGTSQRPLIFICHGLGGILLKRALAFSATQVSKKVAHNYSLFICTYGIIFLGTPHNGLESLALQVFAQAQTHSTDLTELVKAQHETLQEVSDLFAPLAKQFHIFFFWEHMKTRFGQQSTYVVREDSAAPLWDDAERSAIHANHSQMCKFDEQNNSDFRIILDALLRYSRVAEKSISGRWEHALRYLATQRSIEASELVGFNVHEDNRPFVYLNSPKSPEWKTQRMRNTYFHVPHNVSNIFTGQRSLSFEVEQNLLRPRNKGEVLRRRVFVLYGLGGSGKTQFCLKFIEDHRDRRVHLLIPSTSPYILFFYAIFWVDASSPETAERALSHIGKVGGLGENPQAGIYWLTGLDQPWMLVIDNADDASIDYSRFFPTGDKGHILITSRLQDCKVHATVGYREFRNMEEEDAITLLLKAAYEDVNVEASRKAARSIVQTLGYLPLAITQAGASIRQKICTLERYLTVYESHASELMKSRPVQSSDSYQFSIFTTWEVTFQRIEQENSKTAMDATQILQILAFVHFEQVPISIFERAWKNIWLASELLPPKPIALQISEQCSRLPFLATETRRLLPAWISSRQRLPDILLRQGASWDSFRFRAALVMLEKHSLIYRSSGEEEAYSMHPMVHSWARDRLKPQDQTIWSDITINSIATSITGNLNPNHQLYRIALIPHITACLKRKYSRSLMKGMASSYQVAISTKFAGVYSEGGNWREASALQERIIEIRKSALGSVGSETFDVMIALADSYWNLDLIGKSLQLLSVVVDMSTSTLGAYDPRTLRAMDRLAGTMWLCGQTVKAKKLSEDSVDGLSRILSPDHPYSLDAMDTLGRTLLHLNRAKEAAKLHKTVLDTRAKRLGLSHPDTLMAMANLAMCHHALKDFSRAEELLDIVFHERSRVLGEDHAYTLWAINDLSKIRCDRGFAKEAEEMLTEILPTVTRTLGNDHVGMLMTKYNLGKAYCAQERWADGRRMFLEISEIHKKKVPAEHPDSIATALELAKANKHLGHAEEAKMMLRNIIDLSVAVHGSKDRRTLEALGQLSLIHIAQGDFGEAEKIDAKLRDNATMGE